MAINTEDNPVMFFKSLLLELSQERSIDSLLDKIVNRFASQPYVALARIWLIQPGDVCETCFFQDECKKHINCLHLVASAGNPIETHEDWSRLNGRFMRFPVGIRKVGKIAESGRCIEVSNVRDDMTWIADTDWVQTESISGMCGQPLIHNGEMIGVMVVFSRMCPSEESHEWMRMIANHTAAAVVNARAFEEIDRLQHQLELENTFLREEILTSTGEMIGQSQAMQNVMQKIELVAGTNANVLILGESGTGKELAAREIHKRSQRSGKPMIKVNCASIPKELYESEFFGHIKGAFTGAVKDRLGRFQAADGGTLFLDEVGEIPYELQGKLLRVLQEGTYERVGEERTRKVDVRIIAATNRSLKQEVNEGRFRSDLYYRLNVFPIEVPPLRERVEDIPALALHFLQHEAKKLGCTNPQLTEANVMQLQQYGWSGNIRELQNVIQRAVITSQCGPLRIDLPKEQTQRELSFSVPSPQQQNETIYTESEMRQMEKQNIERALTAARGKVYGDGGAAEIIGVKPTTLLSRMKKYQIAKP